MGDILRRRAMMAKAASPTPVGEKLFVGASYGGRQTNGTIAASGNTITLKSTGSATWNLYINPYGNASKFKKFSDLKGHTIRCDYKVVWASHVGTTNYVFTMALGLGTNITSNRWTRQSFDEFADILEADSPGIKTGVDGEGTVYYVVPTTVGGFGAGSGGDDNSYFVWRTYLYSAAGSEVSLTLDFYDCGIL